MWTQRSAAVAKRVLLLKGKSIGTEVSCGLIQSKSISIGSIAATNVRRRRAAEHGRISQAIRGQDAVSTKGATNGSGTTSASAQHTLEGVGNADVVRIA